MSDTPKVIAHTIQGAEVSVEAASYVLELGHLRALVAQADNLGMADNSTITMTGIGKSYTYVQELTAKKAIVRENNFTKVSDTPMMEEK